MSAEIPQEGGIAGALANMFKFLGDKARERGVQPGSETAAELAKIQVQAAQFLTEEISSELGQQKP